MAWLRMIDNKGGFLRDEEVSHLEDKAKALAGAAACVLVERAAEGLALALGICGIGHSDSVLCSPMAGEEVLEAVTMLGAVPVFVDINPNTYNLDDYCLDYVIRRHGREKKPLPKALIATDLFGLPCRYDRLEELCGEHGIQLIEDMGCGFGGVQGGRKAGSFGRFAVASLFHGGEDAGTDGLVFCRDEADAKVLRAMGRDEAVGRILKGDVEPGSGGGHVQGTLLEERLAQLEDEAASRKVIASWYREKLAGRVRLQEPGKDMEGAYTEFAVSFPDEQARERVTDALLSQQIACSLFRPLPCRDRERAGWERVILVNAEQACRRLLLLPMHAFLTENVVSYISSALLEALEGGEG